MKQLLILSLIVGSLDLIGECSDEQKKALGAYAGDVMFLAAKKESGPYINTAERLKDRAKALAAAFPGKNIVEIKKECDEKYTEKTPFDEIIDFITTVVYPQAIKGSFSSSTMENDGRVAAAQNLLDTMFSKKLFVVKDLDMLIDLADRLFTLQRTDGAEYSRLTATILRNFPVTSVTPEQQKRIFEKLLLPLFTEYAHELVRHSPDNQYAELAKIFLGFNKALETAKDADGKTLLHRLFAQDLRDAFQVSEFNIPINWGGSYRELLRLPPLFDFTDRPVERHFGKNTQIAPLIVELAEKIGAQKDTTGDTIFHTLRKNNRDVSKDVDMRALIEHWLGKPLNEGGANLLSLVNEHDNSGKRYVDYPAYIAKRDREAFLDRYTSHALSLFGKSLNALV